MSIDSESTEAANRGPFDHIGSSAKSRKHSPVSATKRAKKKVPRVSYTFSEFAEMVGKEKTWVYRQVEKGRIRAIKGFGAALIPASEIERIFGPLEAAAVGETRELEAAGGGA